MLFENKFVADSKETYFSCLFIAIQVDVFELEAVDLSELRRVVIGHDVATVGDGWKLDRVIIKPGPDSNQRAVFPCRR